MDYPVEIHIDKKGYFIIRCPYFKSCHTYGNTQEDAVERIKEVIDMCLNELEREGRKEILNPEYVNISLINPRDINIKILQLA